MEMIRAGPACCEATIVPAGSIAVVGWLIAGAVLVGLGAVQRRFDRQDAINLESQSLS